MVPTSGGEARQYTSGQTPDTSPRWSPDGTKIAFLSDRGAGKQIYVVPTTGGEAYQVTKLRWGAGAPVWSPDGSKIAFNASIDPEVKPEDWEKPLDAKAKEAEEKKRREEPKHLKNLRIKADAAMGLGGNRQMHVIVVDVDGQGPAKMVTTGDFNHMGAAWSPDGKYLAFTSNRAPDHEWQGWFSDIYVMPAEGGEMRKLTLSNGPTFNPVWMPDGKLGSSTSAIQREWKAAPSATLGKLWKGVSGGRPSRMPHRELRPRSGQPLRR
jgi:Tol biopolymer transport system component